MANTTASTLVSDCLDIIGIPSIKTRVSGTSYQTLALRWLNTAMYRIAKIHDFREMHKIFTKSTVTDTKSYLFPDSWKVIIDLRVEDGTNSRKLKMVRPELVDKYRPYPEDDSTNIPQVYVPYGNEFELSPIPDAVYTMRIRTIQWPTVITVVTDSIDYEPDKDDVVLAHMLVEAFKHLRAETDATRWIASAKLRLSEAIKQDKRRPDWSPVAQGFSSIPYRDFYYAEDRYSTATGEWIVSPFLYSKY